MLNQTPRAQALLRLGQPEGLPFLGYVVRQMLDGALPHTTLLAVCPNSEAVARAALRAAYRVDAPVLFAATLNQVDVDGGYTGWTPQTFVAFVEQEAARIGLDVPILPCLDHGGPWLKDAHAQAGLSLDDTMDAVRTSLEACLDAGYALLHLDPTVDRTLPPDASIPIERVTDRTLDLFAHAEAYRTARALPPVAYEVGTEEVHGGLADLMTFERFLARLAAGLDAMGLQGAWPCFVVGKVGTDLHTTHFDADVARALTGVARRYGTLVKGHYTDYVANPEAYPLSGMGAANVGPELAEVEYGALLDLVALEREIGEDSGFEQALYAAVDASGRWRKWLQPGEDGAALADLDPSRRAWLVATGSRYVWTDARVREARAVLYHHLESVRDADAYVLWKIETAILHYAHAFHLVGLNARLLEKA